VVDSTAKRCQEGGDTLYRTKTLFLFYVLDMASPKLPEIPDVLHLFQRTLSVGVLDYFQKQAGLRIRRGVYAAQVVLWLMILQRLHAVGTLVTAVQLLLQGAAAPLLVSCQRVRQGNISSRTGGYCRARQKLPTVLCRQVMQEIIAQLRQMLGLEEPGVRRVYLLDGSSLELEHSRELVREYPPAQNQHGVSHWPIVKIVALHEVGTAMAEAPQWGPMYGPRAVSEQGLASRALDQLLAGSVILGDANFGVLWVAYEAQQRSLGVVLRLTEARARKLHGGPISQEGESLVVWRASRFDGGKHHCVPAQATVTGRLIAMRVGRGKSRQWLYLFVTVAGTPKEMVDLYGCRWNMETDLRSLKRTVRLHHVAVKSSAMLDKELFMAICAYNLVRAVMCLAARQSGRDPRQLSFAQVLTVVDCAWSKLAGAATGAEFENEFKKVLKLAAQCTLPKRGHHRSYPRVLWRRQRGFPFRKGEK
jgi:hypothetical protein